SASACSLRSTTIAFSVGLSARMRATTDVITSTHENRWARMPAASSTALALHNASAISHSFPLLVVGEGSGLDLWVRDQIASGKALETIRLHVERFRPPEAHEF